MNPERYALLMVKVVDRAATLAEEEELLAWAKEHPEVHAELERHRALKAATDGWVKRLEGELHPTKEGAPLAVIGWSLFALSLAVLLGGGLTELLLDDTAPLWVKAGLTLLFGSFSLLLFSVIYGRSTTRDPYDEVKQ